jgi:multidrug resistance protein, MATE family
MPDRDSVAISGVRRKVKVMTLNKQHITSVIVIGAPLLAGLMSEYFMYIADSVMVGRLGTRYLAAIGIGVIFGEVLWVMVWPLAPATQAIASRRFGVQEAFSGSGTGERSVLSKNIGQVLDHAILVALFAGIFAMLAVVPGKIALGYLMKGTDLLPLAYDYIDIIKWVLPFGAIYYAIYGFLAAINKTRVIMVASVILNSLNIIFNYLLIFGKFGFPAMGIKGAAWGTVAAQALGMLYLVIHVISVSDLKKYGCFDFRSIEFRMIRDLWKTVFPIACQLGIAFSIYLVYESMVAKIGIVYLAATHVAFSIFQINHAVVGGFAEGASILIGNALGRGDREEAINYSYACEIIAMFLGLALFSIIMIFPEMIVQIFNSETETIAVGKNALQFFAVFFLIESIGFPLEIIFSHNGWSNFVMYAEVITTVFFIIGMTLVLTRVVNWGVYGAWTAFAMYLVAYSGTLVAGFFSKNWLYAEVEAT